MVAIPFGAGVLFVSHDAMRDNNVALREEA
jgi:hypothetical protein